MQDNKKTILIVDDTETNIDILLELLGNDYDVLVALDGISAIEIVQEDSVDLILLDIMMPNMDGYEVCQILKIQRETKDIPIIFITAKTDEDSIEKAYDVGGIDYVTKPFKPRELLARVKTQLHIKGLMEDLEFIASYDEMTGIYNRRKFFSLAVEKFKKSREKLYAVMIDIDNFKRINDTYGHSVGDSVIKLVSKAIDEEVAEKSIFGRIGGEEFAIVCSANSKEEIITKIEAIREKISELRFMIDDEDFIQFTISEGVAEATSDIKDLDALLKQADIALYDAKGSGRNRVIFR